MSAVWSDAMVVDALDREEMRLDRLRDEVARGRIAISYARALGALEAARSRAAGTADMIERAALRDDVKTLAEAQVRIRELREQIARQEATIAALRAEHNIDALTGCLDRGGFDLTLGREWNRAVRGRTAIGVVFVDVDRFKDVNDRLGHQGGDAALRAVAQTIQGEAKRSGEAVARYGGDEFVIIVPQAELPAALALGERVRAAVSKLRVREGENVLPLSVSVGVAAVTPILKIKREELLRRADRAVYRAKKEGRDQAVALDVEDGVDVFYGPKPPDATKARPEHSRTTSRSR